MGGRYNKRTKVPRGSYAADAMAYLMATERRNIETANFFGTVPDYIGDTTMSRDPSSSYYDAGGIETFDIIKAKLTAEQFAGYLLGNAIKYTCRMMHKTPVNPSRDAEKASNYSKWLKEHLQAGVDFAPDIDEDGLPCPPLGKPPQLDWDTYPAWVKYFAQDESGACWIYEQRPWRTVIDWAPAPGYFKNVPSPSGLDVNWKDSLQERP